MTFDGGLVPDDTGRDSAPGERVLHNATLLAVEPPSMTNSK